MSKITSLIILIMAFGILSDDTLNLKDKYLPKIFLKRQAEFYPAYNPVTGITAGSAISYYFSFSPDDPQYRISWLGRNLCEYIEPVPRAKGFLNTYTTLKLSSYFLIASGFATSIISLISEAQRTEDEKASGVDYRDTEFNFTGMYVGFGVVGLGLVCYISKNGFLHLSVKEYNKYSKKY